MYKKMNRVISNVYVRSDDLDYGSSMKIFID